MTPDEFAEFSPPYGDCTGKEDFMKHMILFSPPYGDGTLQYITKHRKTEEPDG